MAVEKHVNLQRKPHNPKLLTFPKHQKVKLQHSTRFRILSNNNQDQLM